MRIVPRMLIIVTRILRIVRKVARILRIHIILLDHHWCSIFPQ